MEDAGIKSEAGINKKGGVFLRIRGPSKDVLGELRRLDVTHEGAPLKDVVPVEISGKPNPRPPSKN